MRNSRVALDQRAVLDEELKQLLLSVDDANTEYFWKKFGSKGKEKSIGQHRQV